jgi:hypothetical protein
MTRDLNDRLFALLRDLRSSSGEFSCECGEDACDRSVQLTLDEYQSLRVNTGEPVLSPEHD